MLSYVDILTITLIFFLVAAAKTLGVPAAHAIVPAPPVLSPLHKTVNAEVAQPDAAQPRANLIRAQERLRAEGFEPNLDSHGLVISLPQLVLFSPGADAVNPLALPTIARIAEVLRGIPNEVRLVGYADSVPIHNRHFHNNWDLSMARSQKILELLSGRFGIAESRLSIASYGPYRPTAPNDTRDGRASNRRVEIVILELHPES